MYKVHCKTLKANITHYFKKIRGLQMIPHYSKADY